MFLQDPIICMYKLSLYIDVKVLQVQWWLMGTPHYKAGKVEWCNGTMEISRRTPQHSELWQNNTQNKRLFIKKRFGLFFSFIFHQFYNMIQYYLLIVCPLVMLSYHRHLRNIDSASNIYGSWKLLATNFLNFWANCLLFH